MRRHMFFIGLWLVLACPVQAADNLSLQFGLFYLSHTEKQSLFNTSQSVTQKIQQTHTFTHLGFCYKIGGFCLGLRYQDNELDTSTTLGNGEALTKTRWVGPALSLGYNQDSLVALLHIMFGAKKTIDYEGSALVTYQCDQATIVELGYGFRLANVRVGPLVSLYEFSYNIRQQSGVSETLNPKAGDRSLIPQMALWIDL